MEQLRNQDYVAGLILAGFAIIIIGLVLNAMVGARRRREQFDALKQREFAVMVEEVNSTGWGAFCIMMLVLTVLASVFGYNVAKTVFQQIEAGVTLIAGLILFGLGAALGRRRSYRLYRSEQSQD